MRNERAAADSRHARTGKDGAFYSEDGVLLATVDTFTSNVNWNNAKYSVLGDAQEHETANTFAVSLTMSQIVVEDDEFIQALMESLETQNMPHWNFQGSLLGRNGSEERVVYKECMLGFKYMLGGFTTPTDADLQKVKFRAEQETENDVKAGAIRIASDIIFWNTHLLDGSWDLDGAHMLDVTRGYQLGVAIVAMVACAYNKVTDSMKVRSTYSLRSSSDARAAIRSEFEIDFWNTVYLDGKLLLDGNAVLEYRGGNKRLEAAVTHHMGIEREDVDVEAQVITKTRNYWFLDGSSTLDGKKSLNSIYRKEYIQ